MTVPAADTAVRLVADENKDEGRTPAQRADAGEKPVFAATVLAHAPLPYNLGPEEDATSLAVKPTVVI